MILAVDTSTGTLGIAVSESGRILSRVQVDTGRRHSEVFMKYLVQALAKAKTGLEEISKIACTTGPGSFTGIRVGLTACRMFSQVLEVPLVGVSTLDVLAESCAAEYGKEKGTLICPVIAAQQEEVYSALYRTAGAGRARRISAYTCRKIGVLLKELGKKGGRVILNGDAVLLYPDMIKSKIRKAVIHGGKNLLPFVEVLASIAERSKGRPYGKAVPEYVLPPRIR